MYKDRNHANISCTHCSVAHLCIAGQTETSHQTKLDKFINKVTILNKGEHLYHQNGKMDYLYAVHAGVLKDYSIDINGQEFVSNFYFPGDILGLESMANRQYAYSAQALSETTLCIIPVTELINEMQTSATLVKRFLQIYSDKLMSGKYIRPTTNAKQRVADFLISMLDRQAKRTGTEEALQLPMSQQDMGNMIGIAYETVSRVLHYFQQQQIIQLQDKRIKIANRRRLEHLE